MSNLTRYEQRQLARRVRRELHEPAEQIQYTVAVTELTQAEIARIYQECNERTVTAVVRAHALIQAAAVAGAPDEVIEQLEATEVDFTVAMRHVTACGAGKIASLQAQLPELSAATPLDRVDRLLRG